MSRSDYNITQPVPTVLGVCGGVSVYPNGINFLRSGSTSPYPWSLDLPYFRSSSGLKPGLVEYIPTNGKSGFINCFGSPSYVINVDVNEDLILLSRLAAHIRGHSFQLGVTAGELNETVGMLGGATGKLARAIRGKFKRSFIPHSAWLEAVYGWMPFFSDMKSGAEFLASAMSNPRRARVSASVKTSGSPTSASPSIWKATGKVYRRRGVVAHIAEKGNLAYTGITDPLSTAWELVPYSFVADWFIPISGYLQARSTLAELTVTGCMSTKIVFHVSCDGILLDPDFRVLENPVFQGFSFSRLPGVPSLPLPQFKPLLPQLSNWRHLVDAGALLANVTRGLTIVF